ncbi:MAG: hypothetical protein Tsb009_11610 [Planctomycetaceae bacterium]
MIRKLRLFCCIIMLAIMSSDTSIFAQGRVFQRESDDLSVRINNAWVGGNHGGYLPIRIRVVNTGEARTLTFRLKPRGREKIPIVQKTIQINQNETVPFTLSIPLVGPGSIAMLHVFDQDNKEIEELAQQINLPGRDFAQTTAPALLNIAETPVDCSSVDLAVQSMSIHSSSRSSTRAYPAIRGGRTVLNHLTVSPAMLPDSWIDYTAVDIVTAELEDLTRLEKNQFAALLKWVQCGGTLLIRNVGEAVETSKKLSKLLGLDERAEGAPAWRAANLVLRRKVSTMPIISQQQQRQISGRFRGPGGVRVTVPRIASARLNRFSWPGSPQVFSERTEMLGTIIAFRDDPFPGLPKDWLWVLETLQPDRYRWIARHGMSARSDTGHEFLEFLIPGVKGVPVYAFLFLMTVFTLIIGPINYFLLWKRKRLFLLVLTIPAIAFVTSLSLFGYSAISHGFEIKSRTRSLTILDQKSQKAVTTARIALFAGMTPSDGLQFPTETAVFPIWPEDKSFESGTTEWTDSQVLKSGWLRSRTRTQFLTISHQTDRGRLEISPLGNDTLNVTNGFTDEIESLIVVDDQGKMFYGGKVLEPGKSLSLKPAQTSDLKEFVTLLRRHAPELPEGVSKTSRRSIFDFRRNFRREFRGGYDSQVKGNFSNSRMERVIGYLQKLWPDKVRLRRRTYVAVLKENSRVHLGVEETTPYAGVHILVGYY